MNEVYGSSNVRAIILIKFTSKKLVASLKLESDVLEILRPQPILCITIILCKTCTTTCHNGSNMKLTIKNDHGNIKKL